MDGEPTFGAWLKGRRRQLDLTQKGLAHQVGCSVGTIRKMEADERRPSRQLAGLLAENLDIPQDQHEVFIAIARAEPYIADTPVPVLPAAEDLLPIIPQMTKEKRIRHNLPLEVTQFVGREPELAALDALFRDQEKRLVTILGPGGIGKTRLALAFAKLSVNQDESETHPYKDGVYFVDLAPMMDAERLVFSLAEILNLRLQAGAKEKRSPKQQVLDYLRNRHMLLVLDNFEYLLSSLNLSETDAIALVAETLMTAPAVHVLVTSRERLSLQVEQVYPIQGLAFPDGVIPQDAAEYSAMKLFIQTAQSVQPDFSVAESDWIHLARICHLVEGMPLGLELAGAWVDMLSLADIAAEIQQSLDFLETALRDVPDRHRSIRAAFETSWCKLDGKEQSIFNQLSIFRGGFTREAAQAVTGATLRQLARLASKSFIQFDQKRERYLVHELLRQYGANRLVQDGELKRTVQDRHSTHYCQALSQHTNDLKGARQQQALDTIEADIENVRQAWNYAVARQDLEAIDISIESLYRFYWNQSTYLQEGINDFENAVALLRTGELIGAKGIVLGRLLAVLGWFYNLWGDPSTKAIKVANESLDLLRGQDAREETVMPLLCLAMNEESLHKSNRLLRESLTLAKEFGDQWAIGDALLRMGLNAGTAGDLEMAEKRWRQAFNQFKQSGDKRGAAWALAYLSVMSSERGRYEEALSLAQEARALFPESNFPIQVFFSRGVALYDLGAYAEAEEQFQQGLALIKELKLRSHVHAWIFYLGVIAFHMGDHARAAQRFPQSLAGALEFDDLELVAQNHDALGILALVNSDNNQAREHLQTALQTAIQLGRIPIVLAILATIAELFAEEGDLTYAALLVTFVKSHPASQAKVKERAEYLLNRLARQLSDEKLAEISKRSQQSDLDSLAAQLVIELETN